MGGIPWWAWGISYAGAGAAYAAWFLREWRRNETLQSRIEELFNVWDGIFGLFLPPRFFYNYLLLLHIALWPIPVILVIFFDVPGHGRNVDLPKE